MKGGEKNDKNIGMADGNDLRDNGYDEYDGVRD
jgi:hypothetical protein